MWYEILPSFGIIVVALAAPHGVSLIANKLMVDNFFRRSLSTKSESTNYLRDLRVGASPYKVNGLEAIPDE